MAQIAVLALNAISGGGTHSTGRFVGNVKSGGSFPTTRLDGSPIQVEDYVKPLGPFPFTIDGVTFTTLRDKAYYTGSKWVLDTGALTTTAEILVSNAEAESVSGTATSQSAINSEAKQELAKKVDKINGYSFVYSKDEDGNPSGVTYSSTVNPNTIVLRTPEGNVVAADPTSNSHSATKLYVDNNINNHASRTDNPHSVTKAQVGLGDVVNTSDSNVPVENGTTKFTTGGAFTELAKKVDKSSSSSIVYGTNNVSAQVDIAYAKSSISNTLAQRGSAGTLAVSTPTDNSHAATKQYVDSAVSTHENRTDNPHQVTATQVGLGNVVNTGDSATPSENGLDKFTTGGAFTELAKKLDKVSDNDILYGTDSEGLQLTLKYDSSASVSTIPKRNTSGTFSVTAPTAQSHVTTKKYVDDTISDHSSRTDNPHQVTATQVGLGSVVDTGDSATPVEGGTTKFTTGGAFTELAKKQDKLTAGTKISIDGSNVISTSASTVTASSTGTSENEVNYISIDDTEWKIPKTVVDDELSTLSENPVQNRIVSESLNSKLSSSAVVDNLTTADATKVLSTNQGKVPQDTKLSLTGGVMTGTIKTDEAPAICNVSNNTVLTFCAGSGLTTGGRIDINGMNHSLVPGRVSLLAKKSGASSQVVLMPDGSFKHDGNKILDTRDILDSVQYTSTNQALSANQGNVLYNAIQEKSAVSVSASGESTTQVNYITVNSTEYKLPQLTPQEVFDIAHPVGEIYIQFGSLYPSELFNNEHVTSAWEDVTSTVGSGICSLVSAAKIWRRTD